jgi:uncharacterized protein
VLEVSFCRDERGRFAALSASGHADFAEYGGDIVCAAVSAVLQAARLGLSQFARSSLRVRQKPGELELSWPEEERDRESVVAIVAAAELAVEELAGIPRTFDSFARTPEIHGSRGTTTGNRIANQRRANDV